MEIGAKVKIIKSIDAGKEGEVTAFHTKSVPPAYLQVGFDDRPVDYCTVQLDESHSNLYPVEWVEEIAS